jgi:hypothetical protein
VLQLGNADSPDGVPGPLLYRPDRPTPRGALLDVAQ